jgi:hypothetical protein
MSTPCCPGAVSGSRPFLPAFAFDPAESLAIVRTAEYCRECSGFKGYTDGEDVIEWIVCGRCLPRLAGRGELAGRQPAAVCLSFAVRGDTAGTEVLQLGLPGSRVACPAGRRGLLARWGKAPMSFGMATRAERA